MNKPTRLSIIVVATIVLLLSAGFALADWLGEPVLGPPPEKPAETAVSTTSGLDPQSYLPFTPAGPNTAPWINTQSKSKVRGFYLDQYLGSNGVPHGWNGNHSSCDAGDTTAAFKQAILDRVNYFRQMGGMAPIMGFKDEFNHKAQEAALMMSVNNQLSHDPPMSWDCYTADGAEAASKSNLYLGVYGPQAVTGYIEDSGPGNEPVGHRRWILYPQTEYMGTGDIPPGGGCFQSNTLWVIESDTIGNDRPETREAFISWPPPGYVPYQVVFARWSFAKPFADMTNANVTMTKNGQPISVQQHPVVYGFGERTMVWEPNDVFGQNPGGDTTYNVTITNVIIDGVPQTFNYQVIIFAP